MAAKKSSKSKPKKKKPKKGSYAKNEKFPGLNPKRQVFARREYMEGDYYHLLNNEEKKWLNAFLSETIVTNFYHGGPELYKDIEDKRLFYRENNSRNKDAINWAKAKSMLSNVEDIQGTLDRKEIQMPSDIEDSWLEASAMKDSGRLAEAMKLTKEDKLMLKNNKIALKEIAKGLKESNSRSKKNNKGTKVTKRRLKKA